MYHLLAAFVSLACNQKIAFRVRLTPTSPNRLPFAIYYHQPRRWVTPNCTASITADLFLCACKLCAIICTLVPMVF